MEDVPDADYVHAKRVCKDFEIKNTEYHNFYVQSDTLLLPGVFENFRKMCLKIYELYPAEFFSTPGLVWQAALKKIKLKLDLLTDIDMLLTVGKGIKGGIGHYKNCDENEQPSYLKYLDVNNLYYWAMLQKLPLNNLNGSKILLSLMKTS